MIGVGVKNSTSDLLIANCDEFIYYDDLVREKKKPRRAPAQGPPASRRQGARQPARDASQDDDSASKRRFDLVRRDASRR